MVKIKKGKLTLTVPAGAVRKYTSAGWELAESSKSESKETKPTVPYTDVNEALNCVRALNKIVY